MHLLYFMRSSGGNSHDRRKARRANERSWRDDPGRFAPGDVARITVDDYGKRYKGTPVTVQSKDVLAGYWVVKSSRRKLPLVVRDEHLEKIEAAVAAA